MRRAFSWKLIFYSASAGSLISTINPPSAALMALISPSWRRMARLSPGYRAVFTLHDIEGYEHEEIGNILGCSTGTSKSQLHKARLKLRELLNAPAPVKEI